MILRRSRRLPYIGLAAAVGAVVLGFALNQYGALSAIFGLPVLGVAWGIATLVRARRAGGNLPVGTHLAGFFTAAVSGVLMLMLTALFGSFSVRYTEAVVSAQALLARSAALTLEDVVRRGESLRVSLAPETTLDRLLEQSPGLAYAALVEIRGDQRRPIRSGFRADAERFRNPVEQLVESGAEGSYRWRQTRRILHVQNVIVPVAGPDRRVVAELNVGVDLGAIGERIRELAIAIGAVAIGFFTLLLLLLRHYVARGLVAPLRQVGGALARMADGEADLGHRLPENGDREITELSRHFNRFADRLVTVLARTQDTANENARLFEQQKETAERLRAQALELEFAYAELNRRQDQLLQAEKMAALGRLTAGIAHEINSPLAAVLNSLEMATTYADEYRASALDPEVGPEDHRAIADDLRQALQSAAGATQKVAQFVRTIKNQTRTGDDRSVAFEPELEIRSTLALLEHQLRQRGVHVHTQLDPELRLLGDPAKFSLIVQNLTSNAIDASGPHDVQIWIRLFRADDFALALEVEDQGSGIADDVRPRIFDYMFTTKDVGQGTGLGLAIVHNIVTGHFGGEIQVVSRLGEGSLFRVLLPLAPPEGDAELQPAAAAEGSAA